MKIGDTAYIISSRGFYLTKYMDYAWGSDKAHLFTRNEKNQIIKEDESLNIKEVKYDCQDIIYYNKNGKSAVVGKEYGYTKYECGSIEETVYTRIEMGFDIFVTLKKRYNWKRLFYRYPQVI